MDALLGAEEKAVSILLWVAFFTSVPQLVRSPKDELSGARLTGQLARAAAPLPPHYLWFKATSCWLLVSPLRLHAQFDE